MYSKTSGTKRARPIVRSVTAPDSSRSTSMSRVSWPSSTGRTIRPPGCNCPRSGIGTARAAAVTRIARQSFDGHNRSPHFRENRRLISAAGSDLQHPLSPLEAERFRHDRDYGNPGKALPEGDRQRDIFIGPLLKARRRETLARNSTNGLHDTRIATAPEEFPQPLATPLLPGRSHVLRHIHLPVSGPPRTLLRYVSPRQQDCDILKPSTFGLFFAQLANAAACPQSLSSLDIVDEGGNKGRSGGEKR
jgi:hypothetical protein